MKKFILVFMVTMFSLLIGQSICFGADAAAASVPGDLLPAYMTLGILAVSAVLFFTEVIPLPVTAMLVPVSLSFFHIISAKAAFANFGNQWVIIFVAMFIVGEATFVTGFADKIGELTIKLSKGNEKLLLLFSMASIGVLSAFKRLYNRGY